MANIIISLFEKVNRKEIIMRSEKIRLFFNALFVLSSGMLSGVMLAIGVTLGSFWKSLSPDTFLEWFNKNNHFIMNSTSITIRVTLLGLAGSLVTCWNIKKLRNRCWVALICFISIIIITLAFEVPINTQFINGIPTQQVNSLLNLWLINHSIRITLAIIMTIIGIINIQGDINTNPK